MVAGIVAILIALIPNGDFRLDTAILTCVVSIMTSVTTTLVLGIIISTVIRMYWVTNKVLVTRYFNSLLIYCIFIAGFVMIIVIALCRCFGFNPDNIAIPVAASLGDMVTLGSLAYIATFFYGYLGTKSYY